MPLCLHTAKVLVWPFADHSPARVSLHVLFKATNGLILLSVQQKQQVSHACACDGACGKAAKPALLAIVCEAAVQPHAIAVLILRRTKCWQPVLCMSASKQH